MRRLGARVGESGAAAGRQDGPSRQTLVARRAPRSAGGGQFGRRVGAQPGAGLGVPPYGAGARR